MNRLKNKLLEILILSLGFLQAQAVQAQTGVSGKHIYILYPGVDSVWGSYLFMVNNVSGVPERLTFPVMLPSETIDFQGQDNLGPNELKLGPDGGLTVDKVFPPGENLVNIGFTFPAKEGLGKFTVKPKASVDSLGIFILEGKLKLSGPPMDVKNGVNFSGRLYDTYTLSGGKSGESYSFSLDGVPEGRGRLWLIGWIAGAVLLIVAFAKAYYSRPKIPYGAEVIL